jgi:excinuclease ABC subunit B
VARSDTYIEKESQINEQIDRMRHSATRALLERDDVIIVASVSCIYGIGSVETYSAMTQDLEVGGATTSARSSAELVAQQYRRNDAAFQRGAFRVRGDVLEVWPAHLEDRAWRFVLWRGTGGDHRIRPADRGEDRQLRQDPHLRQQPLRDAAPDDAAGDQGHQGELRQRLEAAGGEGKLLEAQRLEQRTSSTWRCWRRPASATGSRTTRAT